MRARALIAALLLLAVPASAQEDPQAAYVEANLLSIFYHELGHALIDVLDLPVLGQEEDAADTASILLIDALYVEEAAQDIARLAAFGFLDEADASTETRWWSEHGPDLQRYYNLVCLFYGAAPDTRADLASELELPAERADGCADEFDLANDSWGPVLDALKPGTAPHKLRFEGTPDTPMARLIADEVAALAQDIALPHPVRVQVAPCEEANAFYDLDARSITMCSELAAHLRSLSTGN